MRFAGHSAVPVPRPAADAPASVERARVDATLDAFFSLYGLLRSKGYSDTAAQQAAASMMAGREPKAIPTKRFARVYDG